MLNGENGSGNEKGVLGRFVAGSTTGSITGGIIDEANITDSSEQQTILNGSSYTLPDATNGRSTLTFTAASQSGPATFVLYDIDANRMFMIETDNPRAQSGDVRKQLISTFGNTSFSGYAEVTYEQGYESSSGIVNGYDAILIQATASSKGNGVVTGTVNQFYNDENGTFQSGGNPIGSTSTTTFDPSNPGRATITIPGSSDTMISYYYNTGYAFQLDFNGSEGYLATGWSEPQTQPASPPFSDANIDGKVMSGDMWRMEQDANDNIGEATSSSGSITGSSTKAGEGTFDWDQALSGLGYSWLSTTYGAYSVTSGGTAALTCIDITPIASGATGKAVCIENTSSDPKISIFEQ
jgi:hypothetical protein